MPDYSLNMPLYILLYLLAGVGYKLFTKTAKSNCNICDVVPTFFQCPVSAELRIMDIKSMIGGLSSDTVDCWSIPFDTLTHAPVCTLISAVNAITFTQKGVLKFEYFGIDNHDLRVLSDSNQSWLYLQSSSPQRLKSWISTGIDFNLVSTLSLLPM